MAGTHQVWHPSCGFNRSLGPDWSPAGVYSMNTVWAPVVSLYDISGQNVLTFATSDAMNPTLMTVGPREETSLAVCTIKLLHEPSSPQKNYEVTLRLDSRPVPYYTALHDVSLWWADLPGMTPGPVPEHAKLPMYSSWYSFHQALSPEGLVLS
jgi:alpha-galactosidase